MGERVNGNVPYIAKHIPQFWGPVELLVRDANIKCTNTLESRLELLGSQVRRGREVVVI